MRSKKSNKNNKQGDLCSVDGKKYGVPKKRSTKKFGRNEVKYYDFKHFLGKYRLKK